MCDLFLNTERKERKNKHIEIALFENFRIKMYLSRFANF